jgi:hypothetical protein
MLQRRIRNRESRKTTKSSPCEEGINLENKPERGLSKHLGELLVL